MRISGWLWLLRKDLFSQRARLAILILCITLSGFLFGLTFSAVAYLRTEIRPRLRELFPERRVVVRPASSDIMMFKVDGPKISDKAYEEFKKLDGVAAVYAQMPAGFPVSADFEMNSLNVGFTTDIIMFGVDRELVAKDVAPGIDFPAKKASDPVPALITEYFLDAYNLGLAESANMPKLSKTALLGVGFDLILGESQTGLGSTSVPSQTKRARVAGLTANPLLFGVIIPIENMREYNKTYRAGKEPTYAALHIDLASPEDADAVKAKATELKLRFEAQKEVLDRYLRIVGTIEQCLLGAFVLVFALAAVGVFTTFAAALQERRPAWGLHRATGLSRFGVMLLACGHAVAAAIPSALLATAGCVAVSLLLTNFFSRYTEQLSILPGNPFHFGWETALAILVFSLIFSLLPALILTTPICRARPVKLLSERSL